MSDEKKIEVITGILGVKIEKTERTVPKDEPDPWPENEKLHVVGKKTPRIDGIEKVTGRARYTADVHLPHMLYARVVRSPHPHARIKSIDTKKAERHAGVRAVYVIDHLRGSAVLRDPTLEIVSKYPIVRYAGQPIAAVAAATQADADEAARLVEIEYEPLPFVVDLDRAKSADAPLVFPGPADQGGSAGGGGGPKGVPQVGNVHGPNKSGPLGPPKGDAIEAMKTADVVVEATYRTQVQTHSALESHGVVADYKPSGITIYASTQGTQTVRDEIAEVFDVPKSKVRVITEFMGGGFGAKFGIGNFGVIATHLSKKANAPVRLMLDRKEEHVAVGNRPSSLQRLRIGAKKDGTLVAIHLQAFGSGGTGTGAGCGGPARNMYPCPNILTEESDVFTNAGPAAAFRAPGHPQGAFALEQTIDELAEKLKMDPVLLRDKIDYDDDEGGRNVDSAARRQERKIGAERIGWSKRRAPGSDPGTVKRGIGMAQSIWYRFVDLDASCEVRISRDGSVEVRSAVQDIGGGIRTALAQVVAEELGLSPKDITVRIGDTEYPSGVASGGSKTTGSITPAARNAAYKAKQRLIAAAGAEASSPMTFKQMAAKMKTAEIAERASRADDYGGFIEGVGGARNKGGVGGYGGVQFAQVAVDTETGIIKVEKVVAVHDCGRPLNPLGLENQVNGGIIQGMSYALYENRILDPNTGIMVNPNFESYKIAGAREVPEIDAVFLEEYRGKSSTDAGGIGEPATVPTAAAIANAVYNAIAVRIRELPMTPSRVLEALSEKGGRA
jgi:xanthine dehydrogenase YagR molybdenum-binding subunit